MEQKVGLSLADPTFLDQTPKDHELRLRPSAAILAALREAVAMLETEHGAAAV